jgi:phosphatidylglycerol---prolipoprotein diacylglyceryl transferase
VVSASGFAWYGGLAGALLASYLLARRWRIPWLSIADSYAPALALAQAVAKIGCKLAGDGDWGLISTLPWAMAYPRGTVAWVGLNVKALDSSGRLVQPFHSWMPVPPGVRVHPAPIYETILYLSVFVALWSLRKRIHAQGRLFYLYLILAGASRFIVEFIRMNPRIAWGLPSHN